ncbi:hypothetical protein D3C85_630870 [compost metagenome]
MNYKTLEQAFLEMQKGGKFPEKVYEVLDDDRALFFTPQLAAAMDAKVIGVRTIRTHNRENK